MIYSYLETAKHTFIFERDGDDMPIGKFIDFLIDPETGKCEAIWVQSTDGLKLLELQDIVQWSRDRIVITRESDLIEETGSPRIKKIMEREVAILFSKVFEGENYIGKVQDFMFDSVSPRIVSLRIKKFFWESERIIARGKILKITEKGIFISDNKIRKGVDVFEKKESVEGGEVET